MANIIFILGAGASQAAGAPLMNEFLDKARELWRTNKVPADAQYFEKVFNAVSILQRATAKAQLDIHNVESVFSAFEMASVLHSFGEYTIEQIRDLVPAMRIVIAKTIEKTFVDGAIHRLNTADVLTGNYEHFEPYVIRLHQLYSTIRPDYGFGFITFNYDLALDLMFEHLSIEADYGLEETPNVNAIPILKLHGSLNWMRCPNCGTILRRPARNYFDSLTLQHCGADVPSDPVLVPPTWSKLQGHQALTSVWRKAAKELAEAENIVVIGYSLPPSDGFFQFLFGLGTEGPAVLQRLWVFDPDRDQSVSDRFDRLIGTGAKQRYRFWQMNFYQAIDELNRVFR